MGASGNGPGASQNTFLGFRAIYKHLKMCYSVTQQACNSYTLASFPTAMLP